jgi:hypothetical protein
MTGGDCVLRTDLATNCGGSAEEWRLERTLDTRGLGDIEVCFGIADVDASRYEGILLYARDATHDERVFCLNGPPVVADGSADPDRLEWPYCRSLPAWASDNPALELEFVAHSEGAGKMLALDDVVVRGWPTACTCTRVALLEEDFSGCTAGSDIVDGWNGWTVTGEIGNLTCEPACSSGNGARVRRGNAGLSRTVDTTAACGDVRLCVDVGDRNADDGESIAILFDAGSGWQEAWRWEDDWGADGTCSRVCIVLTDLDPAAAGNPALGVRIDLASNHNLDHVLVDGIVVDGALPCPAGSAASVRGLTDESGGSYSLELVDDAGTLMSAFAICSWDEPDEPVEGSDGTVFTP